MPTSKETLIEFRDCLHRQVLLGDVIAYATLDGNTAALRIGEVTQIVQVECVPRYPYIKVQVEVDGKKRWIENLYNVVRLAIG
jgi:hypothetical protein